MQVARDSLVRSLAVGQYFHHSLRTFAFIALEASLEVPHNIVIAVTVFA